MQQGFGGYAANVKANPAQRGIAFDQADLESKVSCAKRCGISAGSRAEYRKVKGVRSFGNYRILGGSAAVCVRDGRFWTCAERSKGLC